MRRLMGYVGRHHWGMLAVFIVLGGTAVAATGSSQQTIHGCANKRSGALRVVHRGHGCRRDERAIAWSKQGPPGPSNGYYAVTQPGSPSGTVSVKVPPGDYLASGGCTASQKGPYPPPTNGQAKFGYAQGFLSTGPVFSAGPYDRGTVEADASVPNVGGHIDPSQSEFGSAALSNSSGFSLPSGGTISEICRQYPGPMGHGGSDQPVSITNTYVTAIRVGSLSDQGTG